MSHWESLGKSDDWYTPKYIFDALGCSFDLDPANGAIGGAHVPCRESYGWRGLEQPWSGFVWLNPPFGGRNGIEPWMSKFFDHGNGIALTPDRTSCPWWQSANRKSDAVLFVAGKIKFEKPDGTLGKSPSNGTTLFASGPRAVAAFIAAEKAGLGSAMCRTSMIFAREAA
jgi:hypothetical protein